MRLSFVQLDEEFLERDSLVISALTGINQATVIGYGSRLFKRAAEYTSAPDSPPNGVVLDPEASTILESFMGWDGNGGELAAAFVRANVIEKLEIGMRVRGMRRYVTLWKKTYPEAAKRLRTGLSPAPSPKCDGIVTEPEQVRHEKATEPDPHIESKSKILLLSEEGGDPPPSVQFQVEPPSKPSGEWDPSDFWQWAQGRRQAGGYLPEKWPRHEKLSAWFKQAFERTQSVEALKQAFLAFGADPYWEERKYPWAGFASQWDQYLNPGVKHAASK